MRRSLSIPCTWPREIAGHPVPCVIARCGICRCAYNPLAVACGSVACPACLAAMGEERAIACHRCTGSTLICPVARAARRDDELADLDDELRLTLAFGRATLAAHAQAMGWL